MQNEMLGTGDRIRVATKEVQRERAIERIARMTLDDLVESFEARREYGPQYGYADAAEWWESQKETYDLTDDLRPVWVAEAPLDPVFEFVRDYDGDFDFILSLQEQVKSGRTLSPRQYEAAERSMKRSAAPAPTGDDPVLQFVADYDGSFEFILSLQKQLKGGRTLSPAQYSGARKCMARERKQADPSPKVTEGMYRKSDGVIFKVQRAVNGSGNLYAKELVNDYGDHWTFRYAKGAINTLTLEDKMTVEQAREFGALYGTCMICGRTLTDEVSIAHGIGPICEGRMVEWA